MTLIAWPPRALERALSGAAPRLRRIVRGALDWAPLLLMPLLYTELAVLNRSVHGGSYFDGLVIAWEQAIFGGQPSPGEAQQLAASALRAASSMRPADSFSATFAAY